MVRIITDTTSSLPAQFGQEHQVPIIPQVIHFGSESYLEGIDIDTKTFMERLVSSAEMPRTAAPPPELFVQEFQRLVPLNEPILCIHPSSAVSGTVRSATVAAQSFPEADIRVIDTRLIASPLGTLVKLAVQWAREGEAADTIEARLRAMTPRCRVYFVVATLEYLARGGRIGRAAALLGSVLQIKPILTLQDGRVDTLERERTHKRALARLKELTLTEVVPGDEHHLAIIHAAAPDEAEALGLEICAALGLPPHSVPVTDVPPAIATHAGPGLLGVGFFVRAH